MIDLTNERLLPLGEVPALIPSSRPGKRLHLATIWRWTTAGVRGVQLETIKVGGSRYTSREAVGRFVESLNSDGSSVPQRVTPHRRRKEREQAAAVCNAAGIK